MTGGSRRASEEGAVLFLAVLIMTAVIAFGMSYAATSATYLEIQQGTYSRTKARGIAEGGLEAGYRKLFDSPTFRGTLGPGPVGDGSSTVEITTNGSYVDLTCDGSVNGYTSGYLSRATVSTELCIRDTFYVGTDFSTDASSLQWARSAKYSGDALVLNGGTWVGRKAKVASFLAIDINAPPFQATADTVYVGDTVLSGSISGRVMIRGNGTINGPSVVTGLLCVDGNLIVDGQSGPVRLLSGKEPTVLLVTGDLTIRDVSSLDVDGSIFVKGSVKLNNVASFQGLGSIVTNEYLTFVGSSGRWSYDPAILDHPPAQVTGGPRCTEVVELWRRPTGFTVDDGT